MYKLNDELAKIVIDDLKGNFECLVRIDTFREPCELKYNVAVTLILDIEESSNIPNMLREFSNKWSKLRNHMHLMEVVKYEDNNI